MPKNPEVDAWLKRYDNPMKPVMVRVRELLLAADARLDECIKWQTPTFTFGGNLASFNPRSKQHASLLFHTGAEIPGKHPRLEGGGDVARIMRFTSLADANAAKGDLKAIVKAWILLKGSGARAEKPAASTAAAKPARKPAAKKKAEKALTKRKATKPATKRKPGKVVAKNNASSPR
jgi:uncharacterized protein YdhG (YjbR/CyaY superfamily)